MTHKIPTSVLMNDILFNHVSDPDDDVTAARHLYDLVKEDVGQQLMPKNDLELMEIVAVSVKSLLGFDLFKLTVTSESHHPDFSNCDRARVGRMFRREGINVLLTAFQRLSFFSWRDIAVADSTKQSIPLCDLLVASIGKEVFFIEPNLVKPNMTILYFGEQRSVTLTPIRYTLNIGDGTTYIEVRGYDKNRVPNSFAIKNSVDVLGKDGEWHDDRLPSGISTEDKQRLRFKTLSEAHGLINKLIIQGKLDMFVESGFKHITNTGQ
ncbi:hypothetical protein LMH73_024400 [Vibrio splendidus]|nr:hypothetical protein [Vibrio splendidus]MCC4880344.1 hypothetical protein [Vibrio splendidus]